MEIGSLTSVPKAIMFAEEVLNLTHLLILFYFYFNPYTCQKKCLSGPNHSGYITFWKPFQQKKVH